MKTIKGTLKLSGLEGGVWIFETDSGEVYQLDDLDSTWKKNNAKLELEGEIMKDMMTIGMMGPVFRVTKVTAL